VRARLLLIAGLCLLLALVLVTLLVIVLVLWGWWQERRNDRRQVALSEAEVAESVRPLSEVRRSFDHVNGGGRVK
jgi:uncharacterized membrane protein YqjE